ncbi:MAG TPA: condensation domain-containing protein, partial [Acidimicrobiales bacterium]
MPGREKGVENLPFTPIDEAVHALDTESEPWTIQLELRVAGHLDEERLRKALRLALDHHPMARVRTVPARKGQRRHHWQTTPEPDLDPLVVTSLNGGLSLASLRAAFYSRPIALSESPPLRVRLVQNAGGDLLMMSINHSAFDGFGALRLLQSVARAYSGDIDPAPRADLPEARDLDALVAADEGERETRRRRVLDKLRDLVSPPARLAPEGGLDEAGYGFHQVTLTPDQTKALTEREGRGTVNDVLIAALNLAVDAWNDGRGVDRRRVSILVPVNLRPPKWREDVVTNMVLDARVATEPGDRKSPQAALDAVVAESERIKKGGAAALMDVLKGLPAVPRPVKDRLAGLLHITGDRLVDTAVLSNLGQLGQVPSFGGDAGDSTEMWFSAPTRMPCGLSIGTVSVGGRLHLSFRYRHSLWSAAAAQRFADRYVAELDRLVAETSKTNGGSMTDDDPLTRRLVHGDESRLHVDPSAVVNNALFNLSSGEITVGPHVIFGHGVSILTGTHDINKFG